MNKIAIASDHAGYELKQNIVTFLQGLDVTTEDLGPHNSVSVDYPDYGVKVAKILMKKHIDRGIIICGTGIGMSIVVNRFPGVRGTLCGDIYTAKLSREHNDSNILILGGRVVGVGLAIEIVETWMKTPFEGGRHQHRLDKIDKIDAMIKKGEI
tara:strand:+ start:69 stop:530 length:462 start_codon:yes stop_codon:yes gene_type:complete